MCDTAALVRAPERAWRRAAAAWLCAAEEAHGMLGGRGSALGALMLKRNARFRKSEPATGAESVTVTATKPGIGFSNNKPTD